MALLPLIRAGLGLSYLQSGLLLSAFTITSGLSQFPGGWLGDRFGRQIVLIMGLAGVGLTSLAVGLSSAYYPLLFILVIMGILSGAYHPSAVSIVSDYFESAKRGKVLALHTVGGSLGFTIGPILGGLIAQALGWHYAFIILSILTLASVPLVFLVFSKLRQREHVNGELIGYSSTIVDNRGKPIDRMSGIGKVLLTVAAVGVLSVLTHFIAGSVMAFIPIYLVDKHGIIPAYAAMLIAIARGGGVAGSLFGGWLSDKWGRRNALFLPLVAIGPILYLITILPFNILLLVIFVLFGFAMYMKQVTMQPILVDSTPPQLRATVLGIYFGLSMEGMSLAQPLAGHFMDIFGIIEVFHVIALIGIALSIVGLVLAKWPKLQG